MEINHLEVANLAMQFSIAGYLMEEGIDCKNPSVQSIFRKYKEKHRMLEKVYGIPLVESFIDKIVEEYPKKNHKSFKMKLEKRCVTLNNIFEIMVAETMRKDRIEGMSEWIDPHVIEKQINQQHTTNLRINPPSTSSSSGSGLNRGPKRGPSMS